MFYLVLSCCTACSLRVGSPAPSYLAGGDPSPFDAAVDVMGSRASIDFIPKNERLDHKVVGTIALEMERGSGNAHRVEIRRISKGYALEHAMFENDAGQRVLFSASRGKEYKEFVGMCLRWSF